MSSEEELTLGHFPSHGGLRSQRPGLPPRLTVAHFAPPTGRRPADPIAFVYHDPGGPCLECGLPAKSDLCPQCEALLTHQRALTRRRRGR